MAVIPFLLNGAPSLLLIPAGIVVGSTGISVVHLEVDRISSSRLSMREFWDPRSETFERIANDAGWTPGTIKLIRTILPWFSPTLVVVIVGILIATS